MSWKSIPICVSCWDRRCGLKDEQDRQPVRVVNAPVEQCGYCGMPAMNGIYVRDNTNSVAYPPKDE